MTTTLIRQALPTEWDAIAALLTTAQLPLDGAHELADRFLVAEAGGELLGCAVVESFGSAGLLRSVGVVPTRRSRGVGHALVTDLIASSRNGGLGALYLLTTTADRYFSRLGFEVIERADVPESLRDSVEFRSACPASATVMRLDLCRAPAAQAGTVVQVRDAVATDAASIAAIYNIGIREGTSTFETRERTPDDVASWLGDPRYPVHFGPPTTPGGPK